MSLDQRQGEFEQSDPLSMDSGLQSLLQMMEQSTEGGADGGAMDALLNCTLQPCGPVYGSRG